MPQVLEQFPEAASRRKYPVEEWMDGKVYDLVEGTDFDKGQTTVSMRSILYAAAKKANKKVKSRAYEVEGVRHITVQFLDLKAGERAGAAASESQEGNGKPKGRGQKKENGSD